MIHKKRFTKIFAFARKISKFQEVSEETSFLSFCDRVTFKKFPEYPISKKFNKISIIEQSLTVLIKFQVT